MTRYIAAALFLPLLFSCVKEEGWGVETGTVDVTLRPYIEYEYPEGYNPGPATKAPVDGQFNTGTNQFVYLGLAVTSNPEVPDSKGNPACQYAHDYYNINTRYYKQSASAPLEMTYNLGDQACIDRLPVYKSGGKVTLSGYYPYKKEITDIRSIPYDVMEKSSSTSLCVVHDHMWFPPVTIDPNDASTLAQNIGLRHVMSYLQFYFHPLGQGGDTYAYIQKALIETVDGGAWLPISGKFDATTGNVTVERYVSSMEYPYSLSIHSASNSWIPVLFPEIAVAAGQADRKLKVRFCANYYNTPGEYMVSDPLYLDLAQIHDGSGNYGLRPGYRYRVNIKYENITKFTLDNIPVAEPWSSEEVHIDV